MGFATAMENLGENLVVSFDNRIKDVARIFEDSHDFLKNFKAEHHAMARKQKKDLGQFASDLAADTAQTLERFEKTHQAMARKQRQFLASFCDELQGFGKKDRRQFCKDLTCSVQNFLEECNNEQTKLHNEFKRAHANFQRAMDIIAKHRAAVQFPTFRFKGGNGGGHTQQQPRSKKMKRAKSHH